MTDRRSTLIVVALGMGALASCTPEDTPPPRGAQLAVSGPFGRVTARRTFDDCSVRRPKWSQTHLAQDRSVT